MASVSADVQRAATAAVFGLAVLVAAMLAVGAVAEVLVFDSAIGRWELDRTDWIARHRLGPLDSVASVGSSLTDTWTVIGVAFGASSMLWLTGHRRLAWVLPVGLAVELSTFLVVSTVIGRARPAVTPLGSVPSTSSFPSGHVAAGVVLYGGLVVIVATVTGSRAAARTAAAAAVVAVVLVASARVYEGVHHPTDVLGGAVVGMSALLIAASSTGVVAPTRRTPDERRSHDGRQREVTSP